MTKQIMEGERETKRVKLMHNSAVNVNSATMQRRLRKMSEEFQPSSFSFMVEARLLCVGMSVVYRLSLSLTITSTCISGTTSGSTTSSSGHTTQSAWVIAMSQTKFRGFYAQVGSILHHPTVTQHLTPVDIQQQHQDQDIVVEWKPFEVFLRILTKIFQRYEHLQYAAFSIQADANTMHTGKVGLEGFLSECWRALEVIVPALVVEPYLPAPLGREVLSIYLLMRDFLSLPENVLDANYTPAKASLRNSRRTTQIVMGTELPFPLYSGFFPQMVLTVEELMHYRRFGKERVAQLVRIIDDADCVYRWTDTKARNGRGVQKAQFLDIRPNTKQPASQQPSTLFKSSVHIVDVQPDEILQAIAKSY
ncbi:Hypothetical protein PHPALM_14822 [Phytophthora palmivora]|uniref:Uncharacterized protein n=1 Tax=Phytophthora palmivora TaxID=4796 RepID=A0A2P4XTR4_9STRA|nr:Hypothetical protein PHPALM_14822 [Phytophthora palmivora]